MASTSTPTKRKADTAVPVSPKRREMDEPWRDYPVTKRITMATESFKGEIKRLNETFDGIPSLPSSWRDELDELEGKLKLSKTIIAVVGTTGAGKSSLMNALLDHRILPTSCMDSCTSVVVEVGQNESSEDFEAKIEFLQEKEWFDELQVLVQEQTKSDGKIRTRPPDRTSETYESYCKMMSAYGKIDTLTNLRKIHTISDRLGKEENISLKDPEEFRVRIQKYIATQDIQKSPGSGLWPIVKHVELRIPRCVVCSNGATLVDLPGAGDSNAARNTVASKYMEKCMDVWAVADIQRAISDGTIDGILETRFKRQLYRDGLLERTHIICTKTDLIKPDEIIRSLSLKDKTDPYTQRKEEKKRQIADLKQSEKYIENKLDTMSTEDKETQRSHGELQQQPHALEGEKNKISAQIRKLEKEKDMVDDVIKAECVKARNEHVKTNLRQQILKAMKNEEDHSDDDSTDDENDDNADEVGRREPKVFCCSSEKYQTLKNTDDEYPQMFTKIRDTGIPELREYVQEVSCTKRKERLDKFRQGLDGFLAGICNYIDDKEVHEDNHEAKKVIESEIPAFKSIISGMGHLEEKICQVFDDLKDSISDGAKVAKENAEKKCLQWSGPVQYGGYPFKTYQATVRRNGKFKSPVQKWIDFNEQLSDPMMTRITTQWVETFKDEGVLSNFLSDYRRQKLEELQQFTRGLREQLERCNVATANSSNVFDQISNMSSLKLTETTDDLKKTIPERQRQIPRMLNEPIQQAMSLTYTKCAQRKGKNAFKFMEGMMKAGVKDESEAMFDKAAQGMHKCLEYMKEEIISTMKLSCEHVVENMTLMCKPLWDATANRKEMKDALMPCIGDVRRNLERIKSETGVGIEDARTRSMDHESFNRPGPSTSDFLENHPVGIEDDVPSTPQSSQQEDEIQSEVCREDCKTCMIHTGEEQVCTIKDVIYGLVCTTCAKVAKVAEFAKVVYVGETARQLKDRIKEHLSDIRHKKDNGVSSHFNQNNHSIDDFRFKVLQNAQSLSKSEILIREGYWIDELKTEYPAGINKKR